jgi:predicted nicotinamide N-methyase
MSSVDAEAWIRSETVIASPPLVPEIRAHLITEACPLWRAGEKELDRLGIPPPYWAFAWPGGQALARYVLDAPELTRGRTVLDFGAGCGLEAIAAAKSGAKRVIASDLDPIACAAIALNARLNGVELETTTRDLIGDPCDGWEVVLAGDVLYDPKPAQDILQWLERLAERGIEVLLADPGRGLADLSRWRSVATYEAPADVDVAGTITRKTVLYVPFCLMRSR